jgi:hypothetical protein
MAGEAVSSAVGAHEAGGDEAVGLVAVDPSLSLSAVVDLEQGGDAVVSVARARRLRRW